MAYSDKFASTDALIAHFTPIVPTISDNAILASYAGFLSVSAVTVYELAIKTIFIDFARIKHISYGSYVESRFDRINGRVKLDDIKKEHIKPFGNKYLDRFKKKLELKETTAIRQDKYSIKESYSNLIICRHSFVHEGITTLTIQEVIQNYERGKDVLLVLFESMKR